MRFIQFSATFWCFIFNVKFNVKVFEVILISIILSRTPLFCNLVLPNSILTSDWFDLVFSARNCVLDRASEKIVSNKGVSFSCQTKVWRIEVEGLSVCVCMCVWKCVCVCVCLCVCVRVSVRDRVWTIYL